MRHAVLVLLLAPACSRPNEDYCVAGCSTLTTGGSGATTSGSGATTGGGGATTSGSGATTSGSGATTSGSGATTSGSGATTSGSGATTSGSGATTSGSGATTSGGGSTTGGPTSCDVLAQTGCMSGEKCLAVASGGQCAPLGAGTPTGQLCLESATPPTAEDGCAAGDACVSMLRFDGVVPANVCREFCSSDGDCGQATFPGGLAPRCTVVLDGSSLRTCSLSCNPVNAADGTQGCPRGLTCNYHIDSSTLFPFEVVDCVPYGSGTDGGSCTAHGSDDCAPGFACIGDPSGAVCRKVCVSNNHCSGGKVCNSLGTVLFDHFGVCG